MTVRILNAVFWFEEKTFLASKIIKQTIALEKCESKTIERVDEESSK